MLFLRLNLPALTQTGTIRRIQPPVQFVPCTTGTAAASLFTGHDTLLHDDGTTLSPTQVSWHTYPSRDRNPNTNRKPNRDPKPTSPGFMAPTLVLTATL